MALKDDVLNNYFSAPLSRRKKILENSQSSGSALPKKSRFFHDRETELSSSLDGDNENKINEAPEDLKKGAYDRSLNTDSVSLTNNKSNNVFLEQSSKANIRIDEKGPVGLNKEKKHNPDAFFSTTPNTLRELSILIKKTRGLQKDVLNYIVDKCRSSGSFDSGPIDLKDISDEYNSSTDFVRTAIKRLLAKNLIMKGRGRTGPTGYSVFYIPSEVKEIILNFQSQL
jgi:hypothetical protein